MIINDNANERDGLLTNNDTPTLTTDDIDESEDENDHRDLFHTYHQINKNQITSYWRWWCELRVWFCFRKFLVFASSESIEKHYVTVWRALCSSAWCIACLECLIRLSVCLVLCGDIREPID